MCDVCDPKREDKYHPPSLAVDGTESYWVSPPLSRGTEYNEVNLTIDLGQVRFISIFKNFLKIPKI